MLSIFKIHSEESSNALFIFKIYSESATLESKKRTMEYLKRSQVGGSAKKQ